MRQNSFFYAFLITLVFVLGLTSCEMIEDFMGGGEDEMESDGGESTGVPVRRSSRGGRGGRKRTSRTKKLDKSVNKTESKRTDEDLSPHIDEELIQLKRITASYYSPLGKLDPFVPNPILESISDNPSPTDFPLDSFKILGIFWSNLFQKAMVSAPGGYGFIVKEGDLIGKNNGYIHRITGKNVVIREEMTGADDKTYFIEHTIHLIKKSNKRS